MKASLVLIAVAAFAISAGAQTASSASSASAAGAAQAGNASASAEQATGVSAELTKKIASKDAKVGDEVVAKTTSETRLSDGTRLPKGSHLVGHVTQVQPKSRENHDASIAFAFDHAVLRDGQQIPIHAVMQSISAPAPVYAASSSDDRMSSPAMGGPGMGAPTAGGGTMRGGGSTGGLLGGAGGAVRGAAGAAGGLTDNTTSGLGATASGATNSTANVGRNSSGLAGTGATGSSLAAPAGPVGNLSGVTFATVDASGNLSRSGVTGSAASSTSTMLSARGKNVTLDSGSQMTLAVAPQK